MVEEFFKLDTLIGGWYIDEKVCDDLIKLWPKIANENNEAYSNGNFMNNEGTSLINKSIKDSDDVSIWEDDPTPEVQAYLKELKQCCLLYEKNMDLQKH